MDDIPEDLPYPTGERHRQDRGKRRTKEEMYETTPQEQMRRDRERRGETGATFRSDQTDDYPPSQLAAEPFKRDPRSLGIHSQAKPSKKQKLPPNVDLNAVRRPDRADHTLASQKSFDSSLSGSTGGTVTSFAGTMGRKFTYRLAKIRRRLDNRADARRAKREAYEQAKRDKLAREEELRLAQEEYERAMWEAKVLDHESKEAYKHDTQGRIMVAGPSGYTAMDARQLEHERAAGDRTVRELEAPFGDPDFPRGEGTIRSTGWTLSDIDRSTICSGMEGMRPVPRLDMPGQLSMMGSGPSSSKRRSMAPEALGRHLDVASDDGTGDVAAYLPDA